MKSSSLQVLQLIATLFLLTQVVVNFLYLPFMFALVLLILLAGVVYILWKYAAGSHDANVDTTIGMQHELESVIAAVQEAVIIHDTAFTITYVNSAAERLFDLKGAELIGKTLQPTDAQEPSLKVLVQVVYPSLAPVMIPRSSPGATPQVVDVTFTDPELELRISTAAIMDDHGMPAGFVKLVRDRTREISLVKSKNEFITVASHQLRTPITEIRWALEALVQSSDIKETDKTMAKAALSSTQELITINEDLLNAAKIEEGHFGYAFQPTDIIAFLQGTLEKFLPVVQQSGISMYFEKPASIPPVIMDPQKITMVLENLLENAIRYNVQAGEITIKAEALSDGPFVKVSVKDSGIGISQEDAQKLFSKFFRAQNAMKHETKGSGLGLYIAKNIIRAHGGQIGVSSELNRGSTFYFTLATDQTMVPQRESPLDN